jgi:hypothetical protein
MFSGVLIVKAASGEDNVMALPAPMVIIFAPVMAATSVALAPTLAMVVPPACDNTTEAAVSVTACEALTVEVVLVPVDVRLSVPDEVILRLVVPEAPIVPPV